MMEKTGVIESIDVLKSSGLAAVNFDSGEFCLLESGFGLRMICELLGPNPCGHAITYDVDAYNVMTEFEPVPLNHEPLDDDPTESRGSRESGVPT